MVDIKREKPRRDGLRRIFGAVVLLAAGVLGFCHFRTAAPRVSAESLYTDAVRAGAMTIEVRGAGTLVPEDTEWVTATTDGRVDRILIKPGSAIEPDTVLLELSNPQVVQLAREAELEVAAAAADLRSRRLHLDSQILAQEAVVAAARAEHDESRSRARADEELAQAGLTSALTRDASRGRERQLAVRAAVEEKRLVLARTSAVTDLAAGEARVDQYRASARLRADHGRALVVRAGRSGIVQSVAVEVGARVSSGANLARVASRDSLKAVLQVSQLEAANIAPGQRVRIDLHDAAIMGRVLRIDPTVVNGAVNVDVQLGADLPRSARPDQSVEGAIEVDRIARTLFVRRPVHARPGTTIAMYRLANDGKSATRVPVRLGRTSFDAVEIRSGLHAGDRVVLSDTTSFDKFEHITIRN